MDDMSEGSEFLELYAPAPEELIVPPVLSRRPGRDHGTP